jgi:hypothetical protein
MPTISRSVAAIAFLAVVVLWALTPVVMRAIVGSDTGAGINIDYKIPQADFLAYIICKTPTCADVN